jgi:hypothetical protein
MPKNTKKPLLKESTVRRMFKLANIEAVGNGFLSERFTSEEQIEENVEEIVENEEEITEESVTEESIDEEVVSEEEMEAEMKMDVEEPGEMDADDVGADDMAAAEDDEVEAEVTVPDTDVEALRTARDVLDQVIAAAGEEGEEMGMEAGAEEDAMADEMSDEMDELAGDEDMEAPGMRNMDLYEAALKGLDLELVDDKIETAKQKLEEVKKLVYKRVVERLLQESKK